MTDHVEFNEPKISSTALPESNKGGFEGKLVSFVANIFGGLIKNEKQARFVVFVIVLFFLLASLYYFIQSFGSSGTKEVLKSIHA
jgi:hypothetical protein